MEKKLIKVSTVIAMLEEGKSREEIGEYYGITKKEVTLLFQSEPLKGKRSKKVIEPTFVLEDDTTGVDGLTPIENNTFNMLESEEEVEQEELEQVEQTL